MVRINPHVNFNGNAEEAFTFYKSGFGGEFSKLVRFKDIVGPDFRVAKIRRRQNYANRSPIGKTNMLMANDVPEILGKTNERENRSKIVINAEGIEAATKYLTAFQPVAK